MIYIIRCSCIREIISDARNLDIAVTKEGHNKLNKNYNLKEKGNGFYKVNDKIEYIIDEKNTRVFINGYYVQKNLTI